MKQQLLDMLNAYSNGDEANRKQLEDLLYRVYKGNGQPQLILLGDCHAQRGTGRTTFLKICELLSNHNQHFDLKRNPDVKNLSLSNNTFIHGECNDELFISNHYISNFKQLDDLLSGEEMIKQSKFQSPQQFSFKGVMVQIYSGKLPLFTTQNRLYLDLKNSLNEKVTLLEWKATRQSMSQLKNNYDMSFLQSDDFKKVMIDYLEGLYTNNN